MSRLETCRVDIEREMYTLRIPQYEIYNRVHMSLNRWSYRYETIAFAALDQDEEVYEHIRIALALSRASE